jgi:ABC-2 type transport system permease protein
MRKVWAVIRREFLERVHTRAFLIGTVLGPLFMGMIFALPILLSQREVKPKHVVVLDGAEGEFGLQVAERLRRDMRDTVTQTRPRFQVEHVLAQGRFDEVRDSLVGLTGRRASGDDALVGIVVVSDSVIESGRLVYYGTDVSSPGDMSDLRRSIGPLVTGARLARSGVDPGVVMAALRPVELRTTRISDGRMTGESGGASFMLAYVMSFLLYFALLLYGMQVMTSVIEEKNSRIVEVLISSLTPFELMLGKIIGVASVALLQLGIWAGTAMLLTTYRVQVAALFGAGPAAVADLPIPTVSPGMLLVFLGFFVLGFLVYSAMYAAVGSMCNSLQEAQQSQIPVTLCILGGLILMFALLSEPNGSLARVMSLVPLFSPFVTPVRYSLSPLPWTEMVLSIGATLAGVVAIAWVASRIYRVGILSYGKKASLADIIRWVRTA